MKFFGLCTLYSSVQNNTVKLRYNNLRYSNIPHYNNIFNVDQKLYSIC